jgi:hypothetical protein
VRVRLMVKLAEAVNGLDLSQCHEGDTIELDSRDAAMLLAEGWAELIDETHAPVCDVPFPADTRAVAADRTAGSKPRRHKS